MSQPPEPTDGPIEPVQAISSRIESVDLLRGVVMVVMVLDHVRDFFGDARLDPTDLASTSPGLFLTRWVTHFCVPTFVLLAGVGAWLAGRRLTRGELSRYLLVRGAWLIFLEQTWGNVFIFFIYPQFVLGLVLWAIGWSMIALAALVHLPRAVIAAIALALIAGHNRFDGVQGGGGLPGVAWSILHSPGFRVLPGGIPILVGYPLVPWVGVMAAGYALGPLFVQHRRRRVSTLVALGLGAVVGFLALRWLNVYGDPRPWAGQSSPTFTVLSFLNCQKYPPSLLYLLMTLGPALLLLAAFERGVAPAARWLLTLGRVPLFFYLLQWPVAHGLAVLVAAGRGYPIGWMFRFPPFQSPPGYGESLPTIGFIWVITVLLLYFPSRWYSGRQGRRRAARGEATRSPSGPAA